MFKLFFFLLTGAGAVSTISCASSRKNERKIEAQVSAAADTIVQVGDVNIDSVQVVDSLKIEFGELLQVSPDSIADLKLYAFVKENLGKKCVGSKEDRFSCEGFLAQLYYKVYEIDIPFKLNDQLKFKQFDLFKDITYLHTGDVLFFNNLSKSAETATHAGFYLQNGYFLIATYQSGIVITKLSKAYWTKHFIAAARITKPI